jgi:putative cell wall-binding protein
MIKGLSRKRVAVLLSLTMLASIVGAIPSASAAAGTYTGGAYDMPKYIANDHTPVALRINVTDGLEASTSYYLKLRFTVAPAPDSATNRGFTWNWTTTKWVQERDAWTDFPVVTTDASGLLDTWVYAKFGDEMTSGTYYTLVSLSKTGASSTYNGSIESTVVVMDMATSGAWVHNGTATGASTAKRAEITSASSTTTVYGLSKTEADGVDSDSNGVVDGEDYGPAGTNGDYRFAVPMDMPFSVYLNRNYTTSTILNKTATVADVDIALMASDVEAPSVAGNLSAVAGSGDALLEWDAATDSGSSGLAGYKVYRWQASPSSSYTNPKTLVATVAAGATSYLDTGLNKGEAYYYEVRAVDVATNVGPRSATVSVTPVGTMDTDRTFGTDRYATAIALSESNFSDSSVTTAVVATGKNFPDALSAAGLAGVYGSPILLVRDSVTASLTAELDRLGVEDVVIIGSDMAVSADIESVLEADYDVTRVYGSDRYATSAAVATRIAALTTGLTDTYIARGDDFADALAASPFAYGRQVPVLLVKTDVVPTVIATAIDALDLTSGIIVGSSAAVSNPVQTALDGMMAGTVTRIGGSDRYVTARMIADDAVLSGWGDYSYVGVATGLNFPDALGGGPVVAQHGGVMLLTRPTALSAPVSEAITANKSTIDMVDIYGSAATVTDAVRNAIEVLLQ